MGEKPITATEMGRRGGTTRARRYTKKQIREWGRRGGRPRKLERNDIVRLHERLGRGEAKAIVDKRLGISELLISPSKFHPPVKTE
jgi:hypothetical protein